MYLLDFQHFPLTTNAIVLEKEWLILRASSQYVRGLPNHPMFFGSQAVTSFYKHTDPSRSIEYYSTNRSIRLLDMRLLQMLVPILLRERSIRLNTRGYDFYKKLCATLGGCSLQRQYELLLELGGTEEHPYVKRLRDYMERIHKQTPLEKDALVSPIEAMGFRIGITNLDYEVFTVLRDIFINIDGFIAPMMATPAHNQMKENRLYEEVVLFNPKDCLIAIPATEIVGKEVKLHTLESIIKRNLPVFIPSLSQVFVGSHRSFLPNTESIEYLWNERDKIDALWRKSKQKKIEALRKLGQELRESLYSREELAVFLAFTYAELDHRA